MPSKILLHIGYHKTATTWMQKQFFLPIHGYHQIAGHSEMFDHVIKPHGLHFDPGFLKEKLASAAETVPSGGAPVVSSELLCGNPFHGGRESETYAARLHQIAPDARILISVRSQLRALPSIYMQYISRGGTMTCDQFFNSSPAPGYYRFDAIHFEYDHLVTLYQEIFGRENVFVMPQESLKDSLQETIGMLAQFCGNTIFNGLQPGAERVRMASYPEHAIPVLRRLNHVQKSVMNPNPILHLGENPGGLYQALGYVLKQPTVSTLLKHHKPASDYVIKHFSGYFRESNARLAEISNQSLPMAYYSR